MNSRRETQEAISSCSPCGTEPTTWPIQRKTRLSDVEETTH